MARTPRAAPNITSLPGGGKTVLLWGIEDEASPSPSDCALYVATNSSGTTSVGKANVTSAGITMTVGANVAIEAGTWRGNTVHGAYVNSDSTTAAGITFGSAAGGAADEPWFYGARFIFAIMPAGRWISEGGLSDPSLFFARNAANTSFFYFHRNASDDKMSLRRYHGGNDDFATTSQYSSPPYDVLVGIQYRIDSGTDKWWVVDSDATSVAVENSQTASAYSSTVLNDITLTNLFSVGNYTRWKGRTMLFGAWNFDPSDAQILELVTDPFGVLFEGGGDVTAPILSSATATVTGLTTATVGATTDEGNGTMYCVVTTSASQPSISQIKAGDDHTGADAVYAANQAIASTGAKTFSATGLTAGTGYYAHMLHTDAAANDSNRLSSSLFTTQSAPTVPTGLSISALTHNSATLNYTIGTDVDGGTIEADVQLDSGSIIDKDTATSHTFSGLTPETLYTFKVRSRDPELNTSSFATIQATTDAAPVISWKVSTIDTNGTTREMIVLSADRNSVAQRGNVTASGGFYALTDTTSAAAGVNRMVIVHNSDGNIGTSVNSGVGWVTTVEE